MSEQITVVFDAITRYHIALGLPTLQKMGAWEFDVPSEGRAHWHVALNGGAGPASFEPEGMMRVDDVPRVHAAVWWNGWLAGIIHPFGGWLAQHPDGANEDRLIADLERLIAERTETEDQCKRSDS